MTGVLLSTKLKNAITKKAQKENFQLQITLHNIAINGNKRGCSGFIRNMENNSVVYVNTENSCFISKYMYRYADNEKDYTGYTNHWANDLEGLVSGIITCLRQTPQ